MASTSKPGSAPAAKARSRRKRTAAAPASRGLAAASLATASPPRAIAELAAAVEADGGSVLASYRDPLGGRWQMLAGLPVEKVAPTPFQRDLSESHALRLTSVLDRMDRFLDPIVAVPAPEGGYWTPNGHHRLAAVRSLGGRSITALIVPEMEVAYQILALNTEKAHNLREKSLEVVRMARSLAALDPRPEREFALQFEEAAFLTLGLCYEQRGRFAGGAYQPVLRRVDSFLASRLPGALETRGERAAKLLALDDAVSAAVAALKERGFQSPYLKAFVVARVNPLRFQRGAKAEFDATVDRMLGSAKRFDAAKIRPEHLAAAGGPPEE